jgi:hypothetical protein
VRRIEWGGRLSDRVGAAGLEPWPAQYRPASGGLEDRLLADSPTQHDPVTTRQLGLDLAFGVIETLGIHRDELGLARRPIRWFGAALTDVCLDVNNHR